MIEKLVEIQSKLKAPKGQWNKFSEFHYRSCEDILEAVKPLLKEQGLFLTITDEVVLIGERYYIKAKAEVTDGKAKAYAEAYAREPLSKPKMDESQTTGSASSYARKYALNGLFGIDDEKDSDTKDNRQEQKQEQKQQTPAQNDRPASSAQVTALKKLYPEIKEGWERLTATQAKQMFDNKNKGK